MGSHVARNLTDTEALIHRWLDAVLPEERLDAWPRSTLLGKIIDMGGSAVLALHDAHDELTSELADVDRAIAALDKGERAVLICSVFFHQREPRMVLAERLGLSLDQFNRYLGRARRRVHYVLEGMTLARGTA